MLYVDYMKGRSRWQLCPYNEVDKVKCDEDFHITWQRYCNENRGEYGEIYGNCPFDFDHNEDISIAQKDCIRIYGILITKGVCPENIKLFFSGKKGFHLELDYRAYMTEPAFDLHLIYRELYKYLEGLIKPERNKSSMDGGIYTIRHMWRYPNTRHSGSGLYCIPITFSELKLPYREIFELARTPRIINNNEFVDDPIIKAYYKESQTSYWKSCEDFEKRKTLIQEYTGNNPPCIQKILSESLPKGTRNISTYFLARFLKGREPEENIYKKLISLAEKSYTQNDRADITGIKGTIASALKRPGNYLSCGHFSYYCDKDKCNVFTQKKSKTHIDKVNNKFNIYTYKQSLDLLEIEIKNGSFDRVLETGIIQLDTKTKILKDSIITIGSMSDVGKTSFAITIAKKNEDKKILYLAIEEGRDRTALRMVKTQIKESSKLSIVTGKMDTITPDDIYSLCYTNSGNFDFMIIDQLGNLNEAAKEERFKYKKMMQKFREIAREFEKPIFVLHQLGRSAMHEDEPRKEHFAEGADIERLSYDVWLLYRKKIDGVLYNLLKIDKNKNYKKELIIPITYDAKTGTFKDCDMIDMNWEIYEKKLNVDKYEYFNGQVEEKINFERVSNTPF